VTAQAATQRAIEAVWRIESARLIAALARMMRDVGVAEDLAQDALVAALEKWPQSGVPDNPGAWLMTAAKHRAIDLMRRSRKLDEKHAEIGFFMAVEHASIVEPDEIGDDLLSLIFTCCHPVLSMEARVALTLRMLGGLSTPEIARAFLVGESTVAQRIARAKKALASEKVPFEVPSGDALTPRLAGVLEVIYLIFNEGYAATAGSDWMRPALCEDALRLGRVLSSLAPRESEVWGLLALMEIQASRTAARVARDGSPILLLDQDRSRWDRLLIQRGLSALRRAESLGLGVYGVQAAIAACHARAATAEDTDWIRIAALYDALARIAPSPVVELNRAVALGMAFGPEAGLTHVDRLLDEPTLSGYHLLPSVRGDLLAKLGRSEEARAEFERAASLTANDAERDLLLARAVALEH
jgi:RNA polymerase sigma-70 factor (ECF subfamily)